MSRAAGPQGPDEFQRLLDASAVEAGVSLPDSTIAALSRYLSELDRWRGTTNLTGELSGAELAAHALECVVGASLITDGAEVIDIGSGAGLPGIPLAIARPDVRMTLLEPRSKRVAFLKHAVRALPISNAAVRKGRVENLEGDSWDAATTRALGNLGELLEDAAFLRRGGTLLAWTTEPDALAKELGARFSLRDVRELRSRGVIAVLEKR